MNTSERCGYISSLLDGEWVSTENLEKIIEVSPLTCPSCGSQKLTTHNHSTGLKEQVALRNYNFSRCLSCGFVFLSIPNFWRDYSRKYWRDREQRRLAIKGILKMLVDEGKVLKKTVYNGNDKSNSLQRMRPIIHYRLRGLETGTVNKLCYDYARHRYCNTCKIELGLRTLRCPLCNRTTRGKPRSIARRAFRLNHPELMPTVEVA